MKLAVSFIIVASLQSQPLFREELEKATQDIQERGYRLEGSIQVEPLPGGQSSSHGGIWQPGRLRIRLEPQGRLSLIQHMRHELMHEAWYQSCQGQPPWAAEAAAMAFSGESAGSDDGTPLETQVLPVQPSAWRAHDYELLRRLIDRYGWPLEACGVSSKILQHVRQSSPQAIEGPDTLLMQLQSARIYEQTSSATTALPLASLLKIPYAASLRRGPTPELHRALARSDTLWFLRQAAQLDQARLQRWLEPMEADPTKRMAWFHKPRLLLGEEQAITGSMRDIALLLRRSILFDPSRFVGLRAMQHAEHSTLETWGPRSFPLLQSMQAWAKTGTSTDRQGKVQHGWLAVVWPENQPTFLAIMHKRGIRGRDLWPEMEQKLSIWQDRYQEATRVVRIQIFSALRPGAWRRLDDCPVETLRSGLLLSSCGRFRLYSMSPKSKQQRLIYGLIDLKDGRPILNTDLWSYVEGAWAQEGDRLAPEAAEALQATLAWNARQAAGRHPDTQALCDTTHCAVFWGIERTRSPKPSFWSLLNRLKQHLEPNRWLMFARGGIAPWSRRYRPYELTSRGAPQGLLSVQRIRTKSGVVQVILEGVEERLQWPCLHAMSRFKLPSCPDSIVWERDTWIFRGRGETHHQGLSLIEAETHAREGFSSQHILEHAFRLSMDYVPAKKMIPR